MGGQSFATIFEKKKIKFRFKVCGIWSLNSPTIVGKFSSNEVFIAIGEEEIHSILIQRVKPMIYNEDEVEVAIELLNTIGTFQAILRVPPIRP
jgi:hypothetical protein